MNATHTINSLRFKLFIVLFLYVFAFYFKGISTSIILGIVLWGTTLIIPSFWKQCMSVLNYPLIKNIIKVWSLISCFAILYPIICFTFDFSFAKLVLTQAIHLFAAVPVFTWILSNNISSEEIEIVFIWIFVIQTIIQVIVYLSPSLGTAILEYNHFDPESVIGIGSGVRGKALSAATTYHLTMAYGIAFILYLKNYYYKPVTIFTIVIGLLLFVGIFFAGRTGFVGCGIGLLGWFFDRRITSKIKWKNILKVLFYTIMIIIGMWGILSALYPDIVEMISNQILPYAFEFIYSLDNSGQMETASTNRLKEMWSTDITFFELIVGTGNYTNSDGSFYMHVDPGILRHMLFMGIIGYALLVYYQFVIFPINKFKEKKNRYYSFLIILFLIIMEFKCINLGVNKFAFSITMLLSFSYLYLPKTPISIKITANEKNNACLRDTSRGNKDGSACQGIPETS